MSDLSQEELSEDGSQVNEEDDSCEEELDLDASATDSEDQETDDEEEIKKTVPKSKGEMLKEGILHKYEELHGKQLYIRFPHKLPVDDEEFQKMAMALSPLIVKARKPRQKYARFCLVDFKTQEDRDSALKTIKKSKPEGATKSIIASIPRTESAQFIQELAERKLQSLESKKAKLRLKRASKLALRDKNFTSSIAVLNLPKSVSLVDLKKVFSSAVDIQIKPGKGNKSDVSLATITMPSTIEARSAVKQKLTLAGTQLVIRFDTHNAKKPKRKLMVGQKVKAISDHVAPKAKKQKSK